MASNVTHSKSNRPLQSKAASILYGVLLLIPAANVAFAADPKEVTKGILDEAIPELQKTMASISQGCPGGGSGIPPLNWQGRQTPGNESVEAFSKARTALGEGRIEDVKQQINSGLSKWNQLVNSLHESCEGGRSGLDPVNYGNYVRYRDVLSERLKTTLRYL